MSRRQALGLGVAGLGAVTLAACSSGNGSTVPQSSTSGTGAAEDFSFAAWSLSEDAPKVVVQKAVDTFAATEGVSITTSNYPYNDYLNQMILQTRGNQFAGAAQLDIAWLSTMAALGKLVDLSEYAADAGYTESALRTGQSDGAQYGLPWTNAAIGLIGNAGLLDQAGVSTAPTTITEFEDALRALKSADPSTIPYAASTAVAQLKDVIVWMQTFGSPIVEDGSCTIGDDASVEAMTWYKSLYDQGLIAADVDRTAARSLFSQGRVGYYDDAPAGKAGVVGNSPDADLASKMTPISRPVLSAGDTPQALAWGHLIVVVDGAGASTAGEFGRWLTSDTEQVVSYFQDLSLPPTTTEALSHQAVQEDAFTAAFTERITATSSPSPFWQYAEYAQMDSAVAEQVQAALIGQSSPAEAMQAAGDAVNSLIS